MSEESGKFTPNAPHPSRIMHPSDAANSIAAQPFAPRIHQFGDVTAIMFVASLETYNEQVRTHNYA